MSNFYVAVGEETLGPWSLQEIQARRSAGQIPAEVLVCQEGSDDWQAVEQLAPPPVPLPVAQAAALTFPAVEIPMASYLEDVRARTCYATLRSVITIFFSITCVLVALFTLASLVASLEAISDGGLIGLPFTVIAGGISFGLLFASWQASLILIDIADIQIDQGRRK